MILRVVFNKRNYLKYIGHLDVLRLFQRAFNRADLPIKYSEGFNPHPKFSIASPLSLGIESEEEYMDVELTEKISIKEFIDTINKVLPSDVQVVRCKYLDVVDSVAAIIAWGFYEINFDIEMEKTTEEIQSEINGFMKKEEILITRLKKKGKHKVEKEEDVKDSIGNVVIKDVYKNNITIDALLRSGNNGNLKATDFMESLNRETNLNVDIDSINIKRLAVYAEKDNNIYKPI